MLFFSVYMIYIINVCASKSSEAEAVASHCSKFFLSDCFLSTFGLLSERLENPNMVISGKLPTVSTPAPTAIYILCL